MTRCRPARSLPEILRAPVLAAFLLAGCAGSMNVLDDLDESLRNYHHHLVARSTDHAAAYVADKGKDAFEGLHDPALNVNRLEEFQVVSVRELPRTKEDDRQQAVVIVKGMIRRSDSITVQYVRFREIWERIGARWALTDTQMTRVEGDGGRD